jgi:putative transposase
MGRRGCFRCVRTLRRRDAAWKPRHIKRRRRGLPHERLAVRNRHLAKSISDAAWTTFRTWLEYFGKVFGVVTVAVPPHYTSQNCSNCGRVVRNALPHSSRRATAAGSAVKKSLSVRTHVCTHCGHTQDRDWNAARNILQKGLRRQCGLGVSPSEATAVTVGHIGTHASGDIDLCLSGATPSSKPSRGKRKPKE